MMSLYLSTYSTDRSDTARSWTCTSAGCCTARFRCSFSTGTKCFCSAAPRASTTAVHRRLRQELGVDCAVEERFSFVYRTEFADGLSEYEYDHVFTGEYSGAVCPAADEIAEVRWMTLDELASAMTREPQKFASWFIIAASRLIRSMQK